MSKIQSCSNKKVGGLFRVFLRQDWSVSLLAGLRPSTSCSVIIIDFADPVSSTIWRSEADTKQKISRSGSAFWDCGVSLLCTQVHDSAVKTRFHIGGGCGTIEIVALVFMISTLLLSGGRFENLAHESVLIL